MSKRVGTILSLIVCLMLFSAAALAHPGGNVTDKDKTKNKGHQSRISRFAFWRHHKDSNKRTTAQAKQAQSKQAQIRRTQIRPAPIAGKKDPKHEQHTTGKAAAKKGSATSKTKPTVKSAS